MSSEFDELDGFASEFAPQPAIKPKFDTLPDGPYEFEILEAELTRAQNDAKDPICNLTLRANRGAVVQYTYWLNNQSKVNRFGYDMGVLGFDTDGWGSTVRLSVAVPEVAGKLKGLRFKGTKTSRTYQGSLYHDLHVSSRVGGTPMPEESVAF